ncbi:hypothetical protein [Paenirhodobacter sp.]|uniref:hypothetical protein n=1 Tax=Paenirhodobacter sp. TaxID=1965326 RepID=UPI003B3D3C01
MIIRACFWPPTSSVVASQRFEKLISTSDGCGWFARVFSGSPSAARAFVPLFRIARWLTPEGFSA